MSLPRHKTQYTYYDSAYVPHTAIGLVNNGNTCWLNATLQFLLSLSSLTEILSKHQSNDPYLAVLTTQLMSAVRGNSLSPATMLNACNAKSPAVWLPTIGAQHQQECANEGLNHFLQTINLPAVDQLFNISLEVGYRCPNCGKETIAPRDVNYAIELHPTQLNDVHSADDFSDRIDSFTEHNTEYTCPSCRTKTNSATRTQRLKQVGEVLVVVLSKYSPTKPCTYFPTNLSFRSNDIYPLIYRLVSVVEHGGGPAGGHYWNKSLRGDGAWYRCDDSSISPATPEPTPNATMLAYHLERPV